MSLPRALPTARVYTCLELAREELDLENPGAVEPGAILDELLGVLGVPPLIGDPRRLDIVDRRLDLCVELVELAEQYHRLERDGTAGLPELPPGVSLTRALDAELERLYGEVTSLVKRLAAELR